MKEIFKGKISQFVLVCFASVTAAGLLYDIGIGEHGWLSILWNCLLAAEALYFSLAVEHFYRKRNRRGVTAFTVLWMVFFPNTLYMLTDLKHLADLRDDTWSEYRTLGANVIPWLLVGVIILGVLSGVLYGVISLNIMHRICSRECGCGLGWVMAVNVLLFSSFGVYIGRFLRYNSWDLLAPLELLESTFGAVNRFTVFFVLYFTVLSLAIYLGYFAFSEVIAEAFHRSIAAAGEKN